MVLKCIKSHPVCVLVDPGGNGNIIKEIHKQSLSLIMFLIKFHGLISSGHHLTLSWMTQHRIDTHELWKLETHALSSLCPMSLSSWRKFPRSVMSMYVVKFKFNTVGKQQVDTMHCYQLITYKHGTLMKLDTRFHFKTFWRSYKNECHPSK